tara:strand:- start:13646 stop:14710 length:1065 start_codon:yes stop_codon:yes gene_type:complete
MLKYYTRACNFYYGNAAIQLIKKKQALPLCGNNNTAFDTLEIITKSNNKITSRFIKLTDIKKQNKLLKSKINKDIKKICSKRKNFLLNVNFSEPSIMGILNLTPDSFSDGGKFNKKNKSFKHIQNMIKSGANIIDVGGESTRPGSKTINSKLEWNRIKYVIKNFKLRHKKTCLSLDTRKSDLMVKGISHKVDLINDVSGFKFDINSISKLSKFKIPKVLHHMQGTPNTMQINPKYQNVLLDVYDFFENNMKYKLKGHNLILDPGIGFGKTLKHNLTLISKISLFHSLGFPILVGTSRKRFINQISGKYDTNDRTGGTLASVLFLLSQGVQIFRVHNVKEIMQGVLVFKKILKNK